MALLHWRMQGFTASLLFGPIGGLTVGALSGGLIDLLSGYPQWFVFRY